MADRQTELMDALSRAVFEGPGQTEPAIRRAARTRTEVPPALAAYVDKVARWAYKVTDEDIAALRAAGYSEDQIFEVTVATAVGAGLDRLDAALRAMGAA